MTTKKIVAIVVSIVLALGLLVVIFVGGILLFVFQQVGNSDAANVARAFLKANEQLKQDIGEVREFGWFITGNINVQNSSGTAQLNLKVVGARKTVNATVEMIYRSGKEWRVTSASYKGEGGKTIELFNPYESRMSSQNSGFEISGLEISGFQISNFRSQILEREPQASDLSTPEFQSQNSAIQISNPPISAFRLPLTKCETEGSPLESAVQI